MSRKKSSMTKKIIKMLDSGHNTQAISERLGVPRTRVYSVRYLQNKELGLGALTPELPTPKPTSGVGTPPKKRRSPRKSARTGFKTPRLPMSITMIEPPSILQRFMGWLRG